MSTPSNTNDVHNTNDPSTSNKNNELSRRDFLKYSAGAVGATGFLAFSLPVLLAVLAVAAAVAVVVAVPSPLISGICSGEIIRILM